MAGKGFRVFRWQTLIVHLMSTSPVLYRKILRNVQFRSIGCETCEWFIDYLQIDVRCS